MSNGEILNQLQQLITYPQESLEVEIKSWMNLTDNNVKAKIAKHLIALANHGGGYLIFGFKEENGVWVPDESNRPTNFEKYDQDTVNSIVQKYSEAVFQCTVYCPKRLDNSEKYPVITVPGGHKVPIKAKRSGPNNRFIKENSYYIRRIGPSSDIAQSSQEWDNLIQRVIRNSKDELLSSIRDIISGPFISSNEEKKTELKNWTKDSEDRFKKLIIEKLPDEKPSRYSYGTWAASYKLHDIEEKSLTEFNEVLKTVVGHETGWPVWWYPTRTQIAPYPFKNTIECWIHENKFKADSAHSDYWRASPEGLMFLLRGFQEDGFDVKPPNNKPGTFFDLTLPVWRVGEVLLHAQRFAEKLFIYPIKIDFSFKWKGLSGRKLLPWATERYLSFDRVSHQNIVNSEISVMSDNIINSLPEIVEKITNPLYSVFDFFKFPLKFIDEELLKMLKKK